MAGAFPFETFAEDGSLVGSARRWQGVTRADHATRLSLRRLDQVQAAAAPAAPPQEPPPVHSEEALAQALAAAREAARAEATAAVRAELRAGIEQQQADALAAIAAQLASRRDALEQTLAARAGASRELALALARALVPEALARQPLADIEAMLRELVVRLEGEPWLEIRLAPEPAAAAEASLLALAEEAGYRGALRVLPDARLGAGDARLSWQDGLAERDLERLESAAIALVDAWLPEPPHAPAARARDAASVESEP